MEKKKRRSWIIILLVVLVLLAVFSVVVYRIIKNLNDNKRAQNTPPTVHINSPLAGETVSIGENLVVSATAMGRTPISKLQLWMDGQLLEEQVSFNVGDSAFTGLFPIAVPEGGHMLVARAVDMDGLVGQTLPLPIYGAAELADAGLLVYTSLEGETLQDIANALGIDIDTLRALNPGLGDGILPTGTPVNLPITADPGEDEPLPEEPPAAAVVPPPPPAAPPNKPMLISIAQAVPLPDFGGFLAQIDLLLPPAPDNLGASVEGCQVTLTWNDNSESEDAFRIWFAGLGTPPRVIDTVSSSEHTGPVWYRFDTPPAGIYSFWVEAVNKMGAQASEQVWMGVPATQCAHYTASYLQLEVNKITYYGKTYEHFYTYVSFEGLQEQRLPADDSEFFLGFFNRDIVTTLIGRNIITLPIPADGILNLEGKGMGWTGGSPFPLGKFKSSLPSSAWDGTEHVIQSDNYEISLKVQPFGEMESRGTYTFYDPSIYPPKIIDEIDTGKRGNPFHPTDRILVWEWNGDESAIEGFTVFLNGNPFKAALPHERQAYYSLPATCGAKMKFEVAVNLPNGQSRRSEPFEYNLDPCPMWAEVQFISLETGETNDSLRGKCDQIETYFELVAWGADTAKVNLGRASGYSFRYPMVCKTRYTFHDIGYALTRKNDMDKLVVQIDPHNLYLEVGIFGWDYDWGTGNDPLVINRVQITDLPDHNWEGFEKEYTFNNYQEAGSTFTTFRVKSVPGP